MPFGISGIAASPANLELHRQGRSLGLDRALAEGYVAVYAEVYALAFAEGFVKGYIQYARIFLLRRGTKKPGPPVEWIEAEIATMGDIERLDELIDRIDVVSTWADLLAPPDPES